MRKSHMWYSRYVHIVVYVCDMETNHPDRDLHCVITSLSTKLKRAGILEVKINTHRADCWSQSLPGSESTGSGCCRFWQKPYLGMITSRVKLGSDSSRWMTKSIRSTLLSQGELHTDIQTVFTEPSWADKTWEPKLALKIKCIYTLNRMWSGPLCEYYPAEKK